MYKNKAFISYRHSSCDIKTAILLQRQLETFRIPKAIAISRKITRIGRIFRDQTDLSAHADLTEKLRRELDNSEFLIVVCSPDSVGSRWISEEIRYFLKSHGAAQIIPVLSAGEPNEVLEGMFGQIEGMPSELRACDCRGSRSRVIREEIPRIAAALIGCGYDELVGRYRRYRQRRIAAMMAVTAAIMVFAAVFYKISDSRLQKAREENQLRESRDLARRSAASLEQHARFDAIRYAVEALPETEEDRPIAGEAVLALQKAVNAYIPQGGEGLGQTGEYSVQGLVDDWDSLQTEQGTFLAVQYDRDGQYELVVWETESGQKTFDSAEQETALSQNGEDNGSGEDGGNFLMTPDAVLWSDGSHLAAIAPADGSVLWEMNVEGADEQTILAAGEEVAAIYVYGFSEDGDGDTEELQFRQLSDGKLISRGSPEAAGVNADPDADAYTEVPKAVLSADEKTLILEADTRYYDDSGADRCDLYRIDVKTMEETLLAREKELYDFCMPGDSGQLVLLCGRESSVQSSTETGSEEPAEEMSSDSQGDLAYGPADEDYALIDLKSILLHTGEEVWETEDIQTAAEYMCILPVDMQEESEDEKSRADVVDVLDDAQNGVMLTAGIHAFVYDVQTGKAVRSVTFPSPAAAACAAEGADGEVLQILSGDGGCYTWDYKNDKVLLRPAALPADISGASAAGDSVFVYCPDDSGENFAERIAEYRKGVGDRSLCKADIREEEDSETDIPDEDYIVGTFVDEDLFAVMTEAGDIYGIDAEGKIRWSYRSKESYRVTGVSEECGMIVLHPDAEDESDGDRWLLLDTASGETRAITNPAACIRDENLAEAEYPDEILAGEYMEFAVSVPAEESGSADGTYIVRYCLSDGSAQAIDVTGKIEDNENESIVLYGDSSGMHTLCFSSRLDGKTAERFLCIDWKTGAVQEQTMEENSFLIHNGSAKWDEEEKYLAVMDSDNRIRMFGTDGTVSALEIGQTENLGKNTGAEQAEDEQRISRIAGFDFYKGQPVTVEAERNSLWFRSADGSVDIELPVSREDAAAELLDGYMGETRVSVTVLEDDKLLLTYGDEVFVIDPEQQAVETAVGEVLEYSPSADALLIGKGREVYLAGRYSCSELLQKANEILQGAGTEEK